MSGCMYCDDGNVAVVRYARFDELPLQGNKYRRECLNCGKHLQMASRAAWDVTDRKLVRPRNNEDTVVPYEKYQARTMTAVGDPEVPENDSDSESGSSEEPAAENEFSCPSCGTDHTGYPDECGECGAVYNWE